MRVQPPEAGVPYLVGGHSYGGVVAVEIALLLESWGHDVGLVLVRAGVICGGVLPTLWSVQHHHGLNLLLHTAYASLAPLLAQQ